MSRLNMSSRAIESSFSWFRLKQAIPVSEMSSLSVICLFRVPGAGLSRHASDVRKIYEGQSFYKDNGKWWGNYQINDLVVFNGFKSGVPQVSILGPLLFLVYMNDLANGLLSNPKLFADDTSIFSVVNNQLNSSNKLNEDSSKMSQWAYQWKMSFNLDVSKQALEVIFSRKTNINVHPFVFFNNPPINRKSTQKHLGLLLTEKLNFSEHINEKLKKVT